MRNGSVGNWAGSASGDVNSGWGGSYEGSDAVSESVDAAKKLTEDISAGVSLDPCVALAAAGKAAYEQGLPLPDQANTEYTRTQYNCFADGYHKAEFDSASDDEGSNAMLIGGLAIAGLIGLGLVASKKGWI